jgi:hypothetical protein
MVRIEVDDRVGRRLLEERVGVVPRPELGDDAREPRRQSLVEVRLPPGKRLGRGAIAVGERLDELCLVHLVRRQRQGEPITVAERACCLVAKPGELADVVANLGPHRLGRLPRLASLPRVVAPAKGSS